MKMKLTITRAAASSSSSSSSFFFFLLFFFWFRLSAAQTHPSEVKALNSIFQQWGARAPKQYWNISGEPCSGSAIDETKIWEKSINPAIKCNCTYNANATCHITELKIYAFNKRGVIPEELAALNHLTYLHLDRNSFTGHLPPFIGNLSKLQFLSIAHNAFSGEIPKDLGKLKELRLLALGSNNFSGALPPELGNLAKLEKFYMNSCGASGDIPSTFANLYNIDTMWASDCLFTGKIPSFIGNWTKLWSLRFEGNSFEGPIPSSLSRLTSLHELHITDIYKVSSSLDFIKGLKNITSLVLRNALISGTIPSDIGEYQSLQTLDMSFNDLEGEIPSALFKMNNLTALFLGSNSLTGVLPIQKSEKLQIIDLSYNEISGNFPPWLTKSADVQVNLVANNFTFDSTNSSVVEGLNCLQRDFPCNKYTPQYTNFSIKCGGPGYRTRDGIVFEADNSITIGTTSALYFVSRMEKWAVSNVGLYNDRNEYNASSAEKASSPVKNTADPKLFETSRISPGSLRYYGLGLVNGPYIVRLSFAETTFKDPNTQTWQSRGRRVFDIYIQGMLQKKDFDISREAGGVEKALVKEFKATVSENYLEIHLFWAGRGTCCVPVQGYYGPSISAIMAVPDLTRFPPKKRKTTLIIGLAAAAAIMVFMFVLAAYYVKRKGLHPNEETELLEIGPKLMTTFTDAELRTATGNFSPVNKLGQGGFGTVYKGTLLDGRVVAVKQLSVAAHQAKSQFITEIATISAVQHRNLVKLYGYSIKETRRLLVYEYLENKSLDHVLFGKCGLVLDWPTRFSICLGTARGLAYLHEESRPRIIHRDVKSSNILLDAELCPKISDFGLAKLYDDDKSHLSTRIAGTIGYLAPEYAMLGHLTEKVDVFSFGVVALEILSGRPNTDKSLDAKRMYLLEWAWQLQEINRSIDLVDPKLTAMDEQEVDRVIRVALLCTQGSPMLRPTMSRVVAMLSGDIEVSKVSSKPSYLTDCDFKDTTSSFWKEDTSTCLASTSSPTSWDLKEMETSFCSQESDISATSASFLMTSPVNPSITLHHRSIPEEVEDELLPLHHVIQRNNFCTS